MACFIGIPIDLCVCVHAGRSGTSPLSISLPPEVMTALTVAYHLLTTIQCLNQVKQPVEVQQQP
jgi:hypothetical protein